VQRAAADAVAAGGGAAAWLPAVLLFSLITVLRLVLLLPLLLQVVVPRPGSPLCFSAIEHFAVATFKDMAAYERSADVRQVRQQFLWVSHLVAGLAWPVMQLRMSRVWLLIGILVTWCVGMPHHSLSRTNTA
jgi:hypothetical protein